MQFFFRNHIIRPVHVSITDVSSLILARRRRKPLMSGSQASRRTPTIRLEQSHGGRNPLTLRRLLSAFAHRARRLEKISHLIRWIRRRQDEQVRLGHHLIKKGQLAALRSLGSGSGSSSRKLVRSGVRLVAARRSRRGRMRALRRQRGSAAAAACAHETTARMVHAGAAVAGRNRPLASRLGGRRRTGARDQDRAQDHASRTKHFWRTGVRVAGRAGILDFKGSGGVV